MFYSDFYSPAKVPIHLQLFEANVCDVTAADKRQYKGRIRWGRKGCTNISAHF